MSNKASKIASDAFLPVPDGTRIRYQHYYARELKARTVHGKNVQLNDLFPPVLTATAAWLVDSNGNDIPGTFVTSKVHPNDCAVKKLGRLKAHNRCIKAYLKDHP